jgi:FkbM family methyltransferase
MPDFEWAVPLGSGLKLTLSTKKHLGLLRRATKWREVAIALKLAELVPVDGVIYDIGANIGLYTLVFAGNRIRTIHSFEPGGMALSFLRKNVERNALRNVEIHPVALTDHSGTCKFALDEITTATSHIAGVNEFGEDVSCADLDSYVLDHRLPVPDLVKIDVEGHDVAVLRGMGDLLKERRPIIWLEGGSRDDNGKHNSIMILKKFGYLIWNLERTIELLEDAADYAYLAIAKARHTPAGTKI